jgi:hypothetical protein
MTLGSPELRPDLTGVVVDRWWPHRVGTIIRRLKTRLHVQWSDGEVWRYDAAHARFLAAASHRTRPTKRPTKRTSLRKRRFSTDRVQWFEYLAGALIGQGYSVRNVQRLRKTGWTDAPVKTIREYARRLRIAVTIAPEIACS